MILMTPFMTPVTPFMAPMVPFMTSVAPFMTSITLLSGNVFFVCSDEIKKQDYSFGRNFKSCRVFSEKREMKIIYAVLIR